MNNALICNEWNLPFHIELKAEGSVGRASRSYIHYVVEHTPWVSAKCWATKWLLENSKLDLGLEYTAREYLAGVGIMTTIIQNVLKISDHVIGEKDENCVDQLKRNKWKRPTKVLHEDVNKALFVEDSSDLKFLDYPASSIIQINKKWQGFDMAFKSKPKLVVWTDTSVSYPIKVHGPKYSKFLGVEINSKQEYVEAVSSWLYSRFGYSVVCAAYRANNAVYLSAIPGKHKTQHKHFPIETTESGFIINEV